MAQLPVQINTHIQQGNVEPWVLSTQLIMLPHPPDPYYRVSAGFNLRHRMQFKICFTISMMENQWGQYGLELFVIIIISFNTSQENIT